MSGGYRINFGISESSLDARVDAGIERFGPVPNEGRCATSGTRGWDAMDADVLRTNSTKADGEVVWF
jgi:hypothetical protein